MKKQKEILVCPKCLNTYRPDKELSNLMGILPYGFKCKHCGYEGAGPIKLVKEEKKRK